MQFGHENLRHSQLPQLSHLPFPNAGKPSKLILLLLRDDLALFEKFLPRLAAKLLLGHDLFANLRNVVFLELQFVLLLGLDLGVECFLVLDGSYEFLSELVSLEPENE